MRAVLLSILIEVCVGAEQLGHDAAFAIPMMALNPRTKISSELGGLAFATTEDAKHIMTQIIGPIAGAPEAPDWSLAVDDSSSGERQTIDGFGAAWTDATVEVFSDLR